MFSPAEKWTTPIRLNAGSRCLEVSAMSMRVGFWASKRADWAIGWRASAYDTRFFVARVPAQQEAPHDGFETIESIWIQPEVALQRFGAGELNLISPTFKNLQAIAGFDSTEALLEEKRRIDPASIPTILPRIISSESETFDEILDVVGHGGRVDLD
jgi:hypothetical protein